MKYFSSLPSSLTYYRCFAATFFLCAAAAVAFVLPERPAAVGDDEDIDPGFNSGGSGLDNAVYAVLLQPGDNKIVIGGSFTTYNGVAAASDRVLRLNSDGSRDTAFNSGGAGADDTVRALARQTDNKILIGGAFTAYNGAAAAPDRVMRLNADGTRDTGFNSGGVGANGEVFAVAVQTDGKAIIGGDFTSYNGDAAAPDRVMRLNTDGTRDTSFNPGGAGAPAAVNALFIQPDGKIIVGGDFTSYNGNAAAADRFIRLNTDGTYDATFNAGGTGANASVKAIARQPNGMFIIGGDFSAYNGDAAANDCVMRLNADGTRDAAFNVSGTGANASVYSVALQPDGRIFVGGIFSLYNSLPGAGTYFMLLNADGSPFGLGTGTDGAALSIVVQPDWKVLVGGGFTTYNGNAAASDRIIRLQYDQPTLCAATCYVSITGSDTNTGADAANAMRTVQAAINRVNAGGQIIVGPGLFDPNFNDVTKSVSLVGAKAGVPTPGRNPTDPLTESILRSNTALRIVGADAQVTIDGFSFQEKTVNSSSAITGGTGGSDVGANVTVRFNIFLNMNIGVSSTLGVDPSSFNIHSNHFSGGTNGVSLMGSGAAGPTVTVSNNRFSNHTAAQLYVARFSGAQMTGNTLEGGTATTTPVLIGGCANCVFSSNTLNAPGGPGAIQVTAVNGPSTGVTVSNNMISDPSTAGNTAIFVGTATGTQISGNTITGARTAGIAVFPTASATTISNNVISGPGATGIHADRGITATPGDGTYTISGNTLKFLATGINLESIAAAVTQNTIAGSSLSAIAVSARNTNATAINRNSIAGNTAGLSSATAFAVNATCNWWGAASGPSGAGPGTGDSVSVNAAFTPWLTTSDLGGTCSSGTPTPTPTPTGFESDVAPRTSGDGVILTGDVVQMRRFATGLDTPNPATNELQRADAAPRATFGDGLITSGDVTQARRYATGLDPLTPASGPTSAPRAGPEH